MTIHTTAPLRDRPAFKALEEHCAEVRKLHFRQLFAEDPVFKTLAPGRGDILRTSGREKSAGAAEEGYLYCGLSGAGHFVKMAHNGVEYGLMEACAEGLNIVRHANVGKQTRTIDAKTTPLSNPEHYQYDLNPAVV